jgi:enoyl-[acyl-carrier-protein] reductase (NADH)
MLKDKFGIVFGVANKRSIAWPPHRRCTKQALGWLLPARAIA